jgi:hypothetical protein
MGNKQSQPPPPPPVVKAAPPPPAAAPPPPPLPPPPPVCDAECQRQKMLVGLKTTFDAKTLTRDQDPSGYEQARIAYYTALNGQGWLQAERERVARDEINPKITAYTAEYDNLINQQASQKKVTSLMAALQAQQASEKDVLDFIKQEAEKDKVKAVTLNARIRNEQQEIKQSSSYSYIPIIFGLLMAILSVIILLTVYFKFDRLFGSTTSGGKRVTR